MEPLPDFLLPLQYLSQPFPRQAVEAAIERREESTPHLLNALEWTGTPIDEAGTEGRDYMLAIFAMYLLAQFRETRAYPRLVSLFRNPEHEKVTGEVSIVSLPKILASVCDGDLAPIKSLIEDSKLDEYVRGAAVDSLGVLVDAGRLPREELSEYLGTLFTGRLERESNHVWNSVVVVCVDARLTEHLESIRQLYRDQIAEETFKGLDEVEAEIVLPLGEFPYPQPLLLKGLIDSAVDELGWWDCFRVRTPEEKEAALWEEEMEDDLLASLERDESMPPGTYVRENPKVGRNDPCPCGSGRKFKKCCGAAA